MPLDRHARRFLEMLAAAGQATGRYDDVADRRAALANLADMVDPPGEEEIGGVRDMLMPVGDGEIVLAHLFAAGRTARMLPGILFFHGGGWVAGSLDTHDGFCRRLCNETGCRVIAVDYRLAPEHPFPFGLADAVAALKFVTAQSQAVRHRSRAAGRGGRQRRRHIGGRAVPHRARCRAARRIAFQLLLCPDPGCARRSRPRGRNWRRAISWTAKPGARPGTVCRRARSVRHPPVAAAGRGVCGTAAGLYPHRPVRSVRRRGRGLCPAAGRLRRGGAWPRPSRHDPLLLLHAAHDPLCAAGDGDHRRGNPPCRATAAC